MRESPGFPSEVETWAALFIGGPSHGKQWALGRGMPPDVYYVPHLNRPIIVHESDDVFPPIKTEEYRLAYKQYTRYGLAVYVADSLWKEIGYDCELAILDLDHVVFRSWHKPGIHKEYKIFLSPKE